MSEIELSKIMDGISRTPIHDALNRLMYEGLVEYIPGKGMFVSEINCNDLMEICEARLSVESMAMKLFIQRAQDADIGALKDKLEKYKEAFNKGDYYKCMEYDIGFHLEIAKGSKNSRIYNMCSNLLSQGLRGSYLFCDDIDWIHNSLREHHEMFEAVLNLETEKATTLITNHLTGIIKYIGKMQLKKFYAI